MRVLTVISGLLFAVFALANGITISIQPLTVSRMVGDEIKRYQPCLRVTGDGYVPSELGRVVDVLGPGATVINGVFDADIAYENFGLVFMPWERSATSRTFRYMPIVYFKPDLEEALRMEVYDGGLPEWIVPHMPRAAFIDAARAQGAEVDWIDVDIIKASFEGDGDKVVGYFGQAAALEMISFTCDL